MTPRTRMFATPRTFLIKISVVLTLIAALTSCAHPDPLTPEPGDRADTTSVTIGSQGFAESDILAYVYGLVLTDQGYEVDYQLGIGARETFILALQDGSIDLIPDYSGNLLRAVAPTATAVRGKDVEAALPGALEPLGLSVLEAAPAQDSDALVVTAEFAKANHLVTIGDLAPIASTITIGSNTEYETRSYGRPGLEKIYNVKGWKFVAIDDFGGPATLKALRENQIQVADIFTTNPALKQNDLVVLQDPEQLIAAQNIIPLLNSTVVTAGITQELNKVSAKLTTDELITLNERTAAHDKPSPEQVARDWLTQHNLLSK